MLDSVFALSEGGFSLYSRSVSSPCSGNEARGSTKLFHQLSLASLSPLTLSLHEQTAPASFPVHLHHRLLHFLLLWHCQSDGGKHLSCVNWPQWHCSITVGARAISRSNPLHLTTAIRPQGPALTAQAGRPNNMASLRNPYTSRCIDWDESMPLRHNTAQQPKSMEWHDAIYKQTNNKLNLHY